MNASRDRSKLPKDAASSRAKAEEVPGFGAGKSRMREREGSGGRLTLELSVLPPQPKELEWT